MINLTQDSSTKPIMGLKCPTPHSHPLHMKHKIQHSQEHKPSTSSLHFGCTSSRFPQEVKGNILSTDYNRADDCVGKKKQQTLTEVLSAPKQWRLIPYANPVRQEGCLNMSAIQH